MDNEKYTRLMKKLGAEPEPQLVPIQEFFDGNDDMASIGCNLLEHPGIDSFRTTFETLAQRSDVEAIYAQIGELEPEEDSWPFCDTVLVVGTLPLNALRTALAGLQPDEVGTSEELIVPETLAVKNPKNLPVLVACWD